MKKIGLNFKQKILIFLKKKINKTDPLYIARLSLKSFNELG